MKYIVIKVVGGTLDMEMPFIFPSHMIHSEMADSIIANMEKTHKWFDTRVLAAGEVSFIGGVECSGFSVTLNGIKSRGDIDARLIALHDYGQGMV